MKTVGDTVGLTVGRNVGLSVGLTVIETAGLTVGFTVGLTVGLFVGLTVGDTVGEKKGGGSEVGREGSKGVGGNKGKGLRCKGGIQDIGEGELVKTDKGRGKQKGLNKPKNDIVLGFFSFFFNNHTSHSFANNKHKILYFLIQIFPKFPWVEYISHIL